MAETMPCPACKKDVSTDADACPKCGHPITDEDVEAHDRVLMIKGFAIMVAIVAFGLWFWLGGDDNDKDLTTYAPQVQTYYDEILALATEADGAAKDFALIAQDLAEGQGDVYVAYNAASNAMKISNAANTLITRIKIPDMPGDLEDMLEKARSEMSTCYYVRGNAFESVMTFLDTESPAALQEYIDGLKQAEGSMLRGMEKMFEAQVATGIIKAKE